MRDFRFHVASLIAVFLAIGLGMLIGYSIALEVQMGPLHGQIHSVEKQNAFVSNDNVSLRDANQKLDDKNTHLENEVERLAQLSITGRLAGRSVALISVGPRPPASLLDSIWRTLNAAGASRLSETVVTGFLVPPTFQDQPQILSGIQYSAGDNPAQIIGEALALSIGLGSNPSLPGAMNHMGLPISVSGSYDHKPDLVVLLSMVNSADRLQQLENGETLETILVKAFQSRGIRTIACEPSDMPVSGASYFRSMGLAVVDNVDTVEGHVSLIWSALGYNSHYGTREDADSLLPGTSQP